MKISNPSKLAINGGDPVRSEPFPPWPFFASDEIRAVNQVLQSGKVNYWTGEQGRLLEEEFASYLGVKHAIALANGSVALELALRTLEIGVGEEVIVPSRTFIATASCVSLCGAKPVFVDIDRTSQNITPETIRPFITKKTSAIIVVHLAGWPCEMDPILDLAQKYNLRVIEDCAQAHGAIYYSNRCVDKHTECVVNPKKKSCGKLYPKLVGTMGDLGCFSFCQDKIMTTGGEGGMLVTNQEKIWEKAWSFKDHGKSYSSVYNQTPSPSFRWLHESLGTNLRITEMQAAIGRRQLPKLQKWVEIRQRNAFILLDKLKQIKGIRVTYPFEHISHSYYKLYCFLQPAKLKDNWNREKIITAIWAEGIPCMSGSCPEVYLEKAFEQKGLQPEKRFPIAKELGETSLMFLVHPTLTEKDMLDTCQAVEKVMNVAIKTENASA